jgi:hypothetical protein
MRRTEDTLHTSAYRDVQLTPPRQYLAHMKQKNFEQTPRTLAAAG